VDGCPAARECDEQDVEMAMILAVDQQQGEKNMAHSSPFWSIGPELKNKREKGKRRKNS